MKLNRRMRKALNLLLALVILLPGLMLRQEHAGANGPTWRDITANADIGATNIALDNGKLYSLYNASKKILVRGSGDSAWTKLADLPANQFEMPYKILVKGDDIYVLDQGHFDPITSRNTSNIFKSSDNGQTWSPITGPLDGFLATNDVLQSMFFDNAGNFYAMSLMNLSIRDTNGSWTKIDKVADDSSYYYSFASSVVRENGQLFATFLKINKNDSSQRTTAIYSHNGNSWGTTAATLPGSAMQFTIDSSGGGIIASTAYSTSNDYLTSAKNIYMFNGISFNMEVTTDSADWTLNGTAFDGTYYYIASNDKIRTTNPTFGPANTPPTLTADTSDNDTTHGLELTFSDDAAWRAAITDVAGTKGGTVANVVHNVGQGTLTLTGLNVPGTYEIRVKAAGYQDAVVNQQVNLPPSVWYDITGNLTLTTPLLSVDQAVYAAAFGTTSVHYRNTTDLEWKLASWPQGDFGILFSFISRDGKWYAADITTTGMMTPSVIKVHISADQSVTWSTYEMPSNYTFVGALNPLAVSSNGAVYLNDGKTIFELSENRTWSQIPVPADQGDFKFAYSSVAVNGSNTLYAIIRKYNPMQPMNNTAKLYKYNGSQWVDIADSPSAMMQLYTDSDNVMHAATSNALLGETPRANLYRVDDTGFTDEATLDSLSQARYGMAYGNGYYYILDADGKTIRTTNPNFFTGLTPPALSPDTTDNDDVHPLELTFADNADWRSNMNDVTVKKDGSVVAATYQLSAGVLQFPQALSAGVYTIEISAAGYKKATVQQTVQITSPVLTPDTSDNDTKNEITITFTNNNKWRDSVTSVEFNGIVADSGKYRLSAGTLTFEAGYLPVGDVQIAVKADGYPDATVVQTVKQAAAPALTPDSSDNDTKNEITITFTNNNKWRESVTSVEFNGTAADSGKYRLSAGTLTFEAGYLPVGDVQIAVKADGYPDATVVQPIKQAAAPVLTPDTSSNDTKNEIMITFTNNNKWRESVMGVEFNGTAADSGKYRLSAGTLTFEAGYLPVGDVQIAVKADGYPDATVVQTILLAAAPVLTPDTSSNDTKNEIMITFTNDSKWLESVTSVEFNGTVADSGKYRLSAGTLTFEAGYLPIGDVQIAVKADGYPDATVVQTVRRPASNSSTSSSAAPSTGSNDPNKEVIKVDVLGGTSTGQIVSQAEIVRTTDENGRKNDQVSFTSDLAARAVEALKTSGATQAVIVVPDENDEVSTLQVSLPREALRQLTEAGIGLVIETRGATIQIPTGSLTASSGDLYFRVVPLKDADQQKQAAERAKTNSGSATLQNATVVGRPMTIETNLQQQPVTLTLPLGSFAADQIERLRIYIEHSDGTTEWLKGEPVVDRSGSAAIRFTVTKFSTFTIIDTASFISKQAYMFGYEDGTFRPAQLVTRGQMAAILSRLYGGDSVKTTADPHLYKDAAMFPSWAAASIGQVSALGLMNGYEDGTFQADRAVTRADIAVIVARLAKPGSASGQPARFTDTNGHWAAASIEAAARAGLVSGYEDGSFVPNRELTRAEAVILINRLIGRSVQSSQTPLWSDVAKTHWAFGDIQAASSIAP